MPPDALATSGGRLVLMSTSFGRRGHFHEEWANGGPLWQRVRVTAYECPRISPECLKEERRSLGDLFFRGEYLCEFTESSRQLFATTTLWPPWTIRCGRYSEEDEMADYFVGLDLGQVQDFTAIAVVGLDEDYLTASRAEQRTYDRLRSIRESPFFDEVDLRVAKRKGKHNLNPLPEPVYEVRYLERLPLRTSYTEVARYMKRLLDTPPVRDNAELAVYATGVGVAVTDQLRTEGLWFSGVVITGEEKKFQDGDTHRAPKRDLVARPQVLLEEGNRRLKIDPSLPEAQTLIEELLNYRYQITAAGNDT
jgi:hypothetical protein